MLKLKNNVEIPEIGFGTWLIKNEEAKELVGQAVKCGYRLIDTAAGYHNEEGVGEAIRNCGIDRNQLFVTSKLWNGDQGYERTKQAFEETMQRLNLDYLDLYLVHWPIPVQHQNDWQENMHATWRAMEEIYRTGRVKAIGVSNFLKHHLKELQKQAEIMPSVDQIEYHPSKLQEETVQFCRKNDILVEAWSPLARGEIFEVRQMQKLAEKYERSVAQICLRWEIQNGIVPIPKTKSRKRMIENLDCLTFQLTDEDMKLIDRLENCKGSKHNPDRIDF